MHCLLNSHMLVDCVYRSVSTIVYVLYTMVISLLE